MTYTIGLDYGTNSARAIIINAKNGKQISESTFTYPSGKDGIITDPNNQNLARQNPQDYILALETTIKNAIQNAIADDNNFTTEKIAAIGVDTTGSTPLPIDQNCNPLSQNEKFKNNKNAYAWLWKDHTSTAQAIKITELAKQKNQQYLDACGGTYSSEWFFSKILNCLETDPAVYDAAHTWIEACDFIPAILCGITDPNKIIRSACAAGHKAMFSSQWGGYPSVDFLKQLNPKFKKLAKTLPTHTSTIDQPAGKLSKEWAQKLDLPQDIPVATGALDAHMGAVGSGVGPGKLVKIMGTSTCDILVVDKTNQNLNIPGLSGIADSSVIPNYWGIEAGQAAVGDLFNWFVNTINPTEDNQQGHQILTQNAAKLKPGQSGLLALDWNNGNRSILADQQLTGLILGQTLHTKPSEIYRALIEATAFGTLTILNKLQEHNVQINQIIVCGGISEKNPTLMQIYADITNKTINVDPSSQTCALGSAIAAATTAKIYPDITTAQQKICSKSKSTTYTPIPENNKTYQELYKLYQALHNAFSQSNDNPNLNHIMKKLLKIKSASNN